VAQQVAQPARRFGRGGRSLRRYYWPELLSRPARRARLDVNDLTLVLARLASTPGLSAGTSTVILSVSRSTAVAAATTSPSFLSQPDTWPQ